MLVLENSAGGGGGLGTTLDELALIGDGLAQRGIDRGHVGFCIDVAHAWGAGIDVGDPAVIDAFLVGFDDRIGLERLVMIHLNDTRSGFASRTDRHEHLGAGRIPVAGLTHILRHPRLAHAAYILETPGMDAGYDVVNIQRARTLWAGKPLANAPSRGLRAAEQLARSHELDRSQGRGAMTAARAATLDRTVGLDRRRAARGCWSLQRSSGSRTWRRAARGTVTRGHDMLVLRTFVHDGVVPLLGPPTSIGDVHHGAWYYYLLSPAAFVTGGDSPLAVVGLIALAGIAAVGVVWWLARSVAGPVAGMVAGVAMAASAAAVDESTFIWNPNLIALSSAVALAGAWRAWSGGDRRWWLVAAAGTAITMQCHVLGVALLPIIAGPFLLDARRRPLGLVPIGAIGILVIAYLPLAINELTTGFSEARAASAYLESGRSGEEVAIPIRFGIVLLRVVSWPLTGLIADGFVAASLATVAGHRDRRVAVAGAAGR
jgi:hypothetical protein